MTKAVTHIDCPKEWEAFDDYGSHLPLLWFILSGKISGTNTTGSVTEFGCGLKSTPMIADMCNKQGRHFDFYETDKEWYEKVVEQLKEDGLYPDWNLITSYLDCDASPAILFVDSKPGEERKDLVNKYRNDATIIILHDTEKGAQNIYGVKDVLNSFRYRLDFTPIGKPATTALSNFVDVTKFIDE